MSFLKGGSSGAGGSGENAGPGFDDGFINYATRIKSEGSIRSKKSKQSLKPKKTPNGTSATSETETTSSAGRSKGKGKAKAAAIEDTDPGEESEAPKRPRPPSRTASTRSRGSRRSRAASEASDGDYAYERRRKSKRQGSVRSAKSFPNRGESESNVSDAEDPSDLEETKRPPSRGSNRSRSKKRPASLSSKKRNSSIVRAPKDSDEEKQSLRSNDKSTIFDDRRDDDDSDGSLTAGTIRPIKLSQVERHYLNKALLCLQMQREWSALSHIGELAMYGEPFLPHPTGPLSKPDAGQPAKASLFSALPIIGGKKETAPRSNGEDSNWDKPLDPPMLKYLFYRFIKNFPGLNRAKDEYWQDRIQPFFDSFAERNLSVTRERGEITKRRLLAMGFTRILGTYFGAAITPLGDAVPSRPDARLMRRVDILFPGSMQSMHKTLIPKSGRDRNPTRYNAWVAIPAGGGQEGIYTIVTRVLAVEDRPVFGVERTIDSFIAFADKLEQFSVDNLLNLPLVPFSEAANEIPDRLVLQTWLRTVVILLSNPSDRHRDHPALTKARQQLERFLLDRPMKLGERRRAELIDAARQDDELAEREKTAWQAAGKRARELRTTWAMYRDALIGAHELDKSWNLVKRFDRIKDLPRLHRDAVQWASLWVAYTLHYLYKTSPQAADLFTLTKGFHSLIPYALIKTALRIANPTLMIKTIVNIVLGQPMGQPSLFQRIFHLVMGSEIRKRKKDCDAFRQAIGEKRICDVLEAYVYAPRGTQEHVRQMSYEDDEDIIITILREGDLGESTVEDVQDWREAFEASGLTTNDAFAGSRSKKSSPEALKYLQIKGLLRALCLKRDREQVMEIVDEPNTPMLLKASISVFYNAIYEIAEACNLADRLGDLQAFLQDLIDTVDRGETETADFIKLAARHEQSLYYFIHELFAYGGSMCDPLQEWCRSGLSLLKVGLPDRERSARETRRLGADVDRLINKADAGSREEILREIRGLAQWVRLRKVQNDIWLRCDLIATDPKSNLRAHGPTLVRQFTEQEREAVEYIENAQGGMSAEGGVAWAWFAEQDILENGADIRNDWKKAAHNSLEQAKGKKKKGKKQSNGVRHDVLEAGTILPPPPRLLATKTLVEPWINALSKSLTSAKADHII